MQSKDVLWVYQRDIFSSGEIQDYVSGNPSIELKVILGVMTFYLYGRDDC